MDEVLLGSSDLGTAVNFGIIDSSDLGTAFDLGTPTDKEPVTFLALGFPPTAGTPGAVDPGSDLASAFDLGIPAAAPTVTSGNVNNFDTIDTYKFTVSTSINLNLSLTGLSNNADLKLLDSAGFEIGSSTRAGTLDEAINLGNRPAGTYYAQVQSTNGANANYNLGLSANDPLAPSSERASNLLPIENQLGTLNGSSTVSGVNLGNNDTADVLLFNVSGANRTLGVLLNGLSADADIRIIRDDNGSRVFDFGDELLGSGTLGGTNPEQFNIALPGPGDYFAQVYQYTDTTNYNLTLSIL